MPAAETAEALPDEVISKNTPVFHLHHQESYMPVAFDYFLQHGSLRYHSKGFRCATHVKTIIPKGYLNASNLLEAQRVLPSGHLSVHLEPEHYKGTDKDALHDVPVYAHAKLVVDASGQPEAYEINYITVYAFNGAYNLAGLSIVQAGDHVGDIEHLTVRLAASDYSLLGVWYNSHRNIEGEWCAAHEVPRTPDGRIIAYVALNGHGVYPKAGKVWRIFGVANDYTSASGPVWRPSRVVRMSGLEHGRACPCVESRGSSLPTPNPLYVDMSRPPLDPLLDPHTPQHMHSDTSYPGTPQRVNSFDAAMVKPTARPILLQPRMLDHAIPQMQRQQQKTLTHGVQTMQPMYLTDSYNEHPHSQGTGGRRMLSESGLTTVTAVQPSRTGTAGSPHGSAHHHQGQGLPHQQHQQSLLEECMGLTSGTEPSSRMADGPKGQQGPQRAGQAQPGVVGPCMVSAAAVAVASSTEAFQRVSLSDSCHALGYDGSGRACTGGGLAAAGGGAAGGVQGRVSGSGRRLPVVVDDFSGWQRYQGRWGTAPSPAQQCWFTGAEPPVSRSALQRLCLPLAAGVDRLPPSSTSGSSSSSRSLSLSASSGAPHAASSSSSSLSRARAAQSAGAALSSAGSEIAGAAQKAVGGLRSFIKQVSKGRL